MMKLWMLLALSVAFLGFSTAVDTLSSDLSVSSAERSIDIASQLVKIGTKLKLVHSGKGAAIKHFHYAIEEKAKPFVVYFGATIGGNEKTYLRSNEAPHGVQGGPLGTLFYKVELKKALNPGDSVTVDVEVVLGKSLQMYPSVIAQKDRQLVMHSGNHYVYLPYKCSTQTTKVTLASSSVESYSKLKPVSQSENTITYGPYANVEPFAMDEMSVHYENNNPFLVVTRMERVIELSMWGNIAVEETLDVRHNGAVLKGSFSRYEFQRENSGVSSVKSFKTVLPAAASDVYYRDDIGNISTSALRVLDEAVEVDLRPRFPLFGGWKTHYVLGYNVPSYEYLFTKGDNFVLNMRVVDHIFDDMLVEDFSLKIILPEGSQVGKFDAPYPMAKQADGVHFTYLDTQGRPVVNIKNVHELTEKHILDFQLEFKFSKFTMIREPLMLIAAFFIFFFMAIIYVRMDFSISKDEGYEARLKVAGFCDKVASHQDKRTTCYAQFDEALVKLKASKDLNAFQTASRKINADHKVETQAIADLNSSLKTSSADVAEKIADLQKHDRTYREQQGNLAVLVEKLVGGKLGKQQFLDQEGIIVKKKDDALDKISSIVSHLRSM